MQALKNLESPKMVKLFIGMLSQDVSLFELLRGRLEEVFGPVDLISPVWPWEYTNYYSEEMGTDLKRRFIFFQRLISPNEISAIKLKTVEIERQYLNKTGGRRINLDPGYLDSARVVLVSTKDYSHRVYLGSGIYGEVTLIYSGNTYKALPYTYPDFRTNEYLDIFMEARRLYKSQIKEKQRVATHGKRTVLSLIALSALSKAIDSLLDIPGCISP